MARSRQRLDMEPADLQWARDDRDSELVLVRDVIVMRVGSQHVAWFDAPSASELDQRLHGRTGIDEDTRPALLVRDEVGIRQPARIHASFGEHRWIGYFDIDEED